MRMNTFQISHDMIIFQMKDNEGRVDLDEKKETKGYSR